MTTSNPAETILKVRADKWLWAARFFRTRSLAKEAIEGGRVHMDGKKIKTSKELKIGDILTIRQGNASTQEQKTIIIKALSEQRANFTITSSLYEEAEESIITRDFLDEQRKWQNLAKPDTKPNKKERRNLQKLHSQW